VIFGNMNNDLEGYLKRGWKIQQIVDGISLNESIYESNKEIDLELRNYDVFF